MTNLEEVGNEEHSLSAFFNQETTLLNELIISNSIKIDD